MLIDRGPFRRKSIKDYVSQMSTPNPKVVFDDHVAQILERQGFTWEENPRSIYEPEQLYTSLKEYASDWSAFEKTDVHIKHGLAKGFKIFAKPKDLPHLQILSDADVASSALKLDKSSGLPLLVSKAESLIYSFDREKQIREGLKAPNPCIAYKRTQTGNKTRLVWGYPLEMTIMEARFARPLIDHFKQSRSPMAFGITKTELGSYIHRYIVDKPGTIVSLDYSGYDRKISKTLIKEAFRIIATWFDPEDLKTYGWNRIVSYFIRTPIVMPDGHLYGGKEHGVPSGSYFTQLIDSIVNVVLIYALCSRFNLDVSPRSIFVLGDDSIINVRKGFVDLKAWGNYLSNFGLKLNVKKTMINEPHFLGAYWYKGKPDVEIAEIIEKAVFPETFRRYGSDCRSGAEAVLRSYASQYLSGIRLLPSLRMADQRSVDMPFSDDKVVPSYLSGSDRYLLGERKYTPAGQEKAYPPTISVRFMT